MPSGPGTYGSKRGRPKKSEPKKGMKSKTMPGKEDFTTKKGSKDFDRGGKREKTDARCRRAGEGSGASLLRHVAHIMHN